ncbi:MAG: hypothetical protein ABS52_04730 [Gemmatimonadetes bacterium SCN 70-22]|nr:MAG: hypothetical protein ABS52_04730 [Gemmatimonadetes bacterium SCN 70-22]
MAERHQLRRLGGSQQSRLHEGLQLVRERLKDSRRGRQVLAAVGHCGTGRIDFRDQAIPLAGVQQSAAYPALSERDHSREDGELVRDDRQ